MSPMADQLQKKPIETAASRRLASRFLAERAARVAVLADWIAGFGEFEDAACDRRAVRAAAWFQDAWCVGDARVEGPSAPVVLAVQPTDFQRERAADIAAESLADIVDAGTLTTAARAIREAGAHETNVPEAVILREATNLDSIGPLWLWGQVARCAAEDRPVASVVAVWERHVEYDYWAKRISETLRFKRSRELAHHRCRTMDAYFLALRDQLTGADRHVAPEAHD